MALSTVQSGALKGKTLVDNTSVPRSDLSTITQQLHYARRLAADPAFASRVRLMARADAVICGAETALEHVVRTSDAVARTHERDEQMARRITREKRRYLE